MNGNILILGLGTFGAEAARVLNQKGADVFAVDHHERAVAALRDSATRVIQADVTDEEALETAGMLDAETAIIALRRHFDTSVLATFMLKERGFKRILVQVDNIKEAAAIRSVGATTVIFPEQDMARRIAHQILIPNLVDQIPLGDQFGIVEVPCPDNFVGKTLADLGIRRAYGVTVIALKSPPENAGGTEQVEVSPAPDEPLRAEQRLLLLGKTSLLAHFSEKTNGEK